MQYTSHFPETNEACERPHVTVFCAVWHKQPNKLELLCSHWENLKSQSLGVEPCYIFDNGDQAPDWLDAPWHSFSEPLTIYEAWSAGVALSRTRFVAQLNMDDRLASNAIEAMLAMLLKNEVSFVSGDWRICFDQAHMDEKFEIEDVNNTQFKPDWPPKQVENLRLGSGTKERGTYGPCNLWDTNVIGRFYPSHFHNGEPILSAGDALFWHLLERSNIKMLRLAAIIGRYYSDPETQGEFRPHRDFENAAEHGISQVSFGSRILSGEIPQVSAENTPASAA